MYETLGLRQSATKKTGEAGEYVTITVTPSNTVPRVHANPIMSAGGHRHPGSIQLVLY